MRGYKAHPAHDKALPRASAKPKTGLDTGNGWVQGPRMNNAANPLPNLVYIVSGENREEHQKHWKGFSVAPVWKKLIGDPQCKDNVSRIASIFLKRTSASQI